MLEGKTVVITGGAGGIGVALAREFGAHGARIALVDLREEAAREAANKLSAEKVEVSAFGCDVTDFAACETAMQEVRGHIGGIDVLINNAGLTHVSAFAKTTPEVYRRVMDVNFFGSMHCTKACLPDLIARRGKIAVMSSIAGIAPLAARTGYCASKHALHGFFDTLRCELREEGVTVTLVCPTFTATDFAARGLASDGNTLQAERGTTGDLNTPEAVARATREGIKTGKRLVIVGRTGKIGHLVNTLAPSPLRAHDAQTLCCRSSTNRLEKHAATGSFLPRRDGDTFEVEATPPATSLPGTSDPADYSRLHCSRSARPLDPIPAWRSTHRRSCPGVRSMRSGAPLRRARSVAHANVHTRRNHGGDCPVDGM